MLDERRVDYLLLDKSFHGVLIDRVAAGGRWTPLARQGPAVLYWRREAGAPATAVADIHDAR